MKSLKLPMHAGEEEVRRALKAAIGQPRHKDSLVADIVVPIVAIIVVLVRLLFWTCA